VSSVTKWLSLRLRLPHLDPGQRRGRRRRSRNCHAKGQSISIESDRTARLKSREALSRRRRKPAMHRRLYPRPMTCSTTGSTRGSAPFCLWIFCSRAIPNTRARTIPLGTAAAVIEAWTSDGDALKLESNRGARDKRTARMDQRLRMPHSSWPKCPSRRVWRDRQTFSGCEVRTAGLTFWFRRKKFVGSYLALSAARRAKFSP